MPRNLPLTRDEAEMLVDLLEEGKTLRPQDYRNTLAAEIRELFGMCTREKSVEWGKECVRNAAKELSREEFIQRLVEAGWTKKDAEAEWEEIQQDEEGNL